MSTVYEYKTGQFVSYPIDSYANDGVDSYANEVIERFGYDDPSLPGKLHNVIFRFNNKDLRTYSWNPSSIEPFIEIDYGLNSLALTPTAFVDGGSVRDTEAVEVDDWGRIIYADTNFPFGTLRPVSNTTWTVVHAWVGTGTVFERGDTYYRLVAPYIVTGTLHVTGNTVTHWVPSIKTDGLFGIQSLTDIAFSKQELGSGNLFNIGNGFSLRSRAYETQGVIEVSGDAGVAFQPNWVGSGTVEVDGSAPILRTFGYEASGTLPALNSKDERRTYSYNTSSVVPFGYLDFGTVPLQTYQHITSNQTLSGVSSESIVLVDPGVTASVSPQYQVALPIGTPQNTIEYAPISIGKTTSEDWGFINVTGTKFPFGVSRLKSETLINFVPNYVVQGDISVFGVAIAKTNPIWKGFIINKISGAAITNFSLLHPGSGNLFSIGGGEETRAYAYAGSGDLFNFVSTEERVATDYVGSGGIEFSNAANVSFAPNWISEGVIDVTGAVSDIKRTFAQDEVGNLFVFTGDAYHERRTYDYNDSSISFFRYENFGFIPSSASVQTISGPQTISGESTDPVVRIENTVTVNPTFKLILNANTVPTAVYDHGTITEGYSGNIDWGFISQTVTNYPFGKFLYNGAAKTNFSLRHIGDGEVVLGGEARARVNPQWFAEIQIEVFGGEEYSLTKTYVGRGDLFNFVSTTDSRAFAYQGEGQIFAINGAAESATFSELKDGLFEFVGAAHVSFSPNWIVEGSIKVDGTPSSVLRTFAQNEVSNLFVFEGDAYHERRTYSYNDSSIGFFDYENFGFLPSTASVGSITSPTILSGSSSDPVIRIENGVTAVVDPQYQIILTANAVPTVTLDHGFITVGHSGTIDWGFITQTVTNYPFGKFLLNSATRTNFSLRHIGSGGLKIFVDGRARVNPQWVAEIQIELKGTAHSSLSKVFTGEGRIPSFVGKDERRTFAYEGEGQLFGLGGLVESVSFNPDEKQMLFSFFGDAGESFVPNWNGTARAEIFGTAEPVLRTFGYQAEGSLFAVSGSAERRTYHYNDSSINFYQKRDYQGLPASGQITNIATSQVLTGTAPTSIIQIGSPGAGVVATVQNTFSINPTIGSVVTSSVDCGFITSENNERTVREDYGFTSYPASLLSKVSEYPFGKISNLTSDFRQVKTNFSLLHIGSGSLFTLVSTTTRLAPVYIGSGRLFGFGGASESVGAVPPAETFTYKFAGTADESFALGYTGHVDLRISGTADERAATDTLRQVDVEIRGGAKYRYAPNWNGSGVLFSIGASSEAITIDLPAFQADLAFKGTAGIRSTIVESFTVHTKLSGIAVERQTDNYVGQADLRVFNESVVPIITLSHFGEGRIFALSGAAESFTANPEEKTALFSPVGTADVRVARAESFTANIKLSGTTAPEILTFAEQPFGTVSVFGAASYRIVDVHLGEGTLFSIGQSAEAITIRIPAFQADLELKGAVAQRRTFGGNIGFGNLFVSGTTAPELLTFAEQPEVQVEVFGVAETPRARAYSVEGSIFTVGFTNEAITRKLPAFQVDIAFRPDKAGLRAGYREISQGGTILFSGEVSEPILTFAEQPTVFVDITGVGGTTRARAYEADVFIGHFGGAAESITLKLPEFQSDIVFRPEAAVLKATFAETVFADSIVRGQSEVKYIPNWIGSGTVDLFVSTETSLTKIYIGTGSLKKFSGAAESVTFNPEERQLLFSFSGQRIAEKVTFNPPEEGALLDFTGDVFERFTPNNIGTGTVFTSGVSTSSLTKIYIGDGQLFGLGGAAESVTFNPDEKEALFDFTGVGFIRSTRSYIGDGSLFAVNGAAESTVVVPPAEGLFKFSGLATERTSAVETGGGILFNFVTSIERRTFAHSTTGALDISGIADIARAIDYTGFGNLFAVNGAAESTTNRITVEGDIAFSGDAKVVATRRFIGSGNLFGFDSATESRTIAVSARAIYDFVGAARQRFTRTVTSDINLEISGSAVERFSRGAWITTGQVKTIGDTQHSFTRVVSTFGTARVLNKDVVPVLSRNYFTTDGNIDVNVLTTYKRIIKYFGHTNIEVDISTKYVAPFQFYTGSTDAIVFGESRIKFVQVTPPRSYGWII